MGEAMLAEVDIDISVLVAAGSGDRGTQKQKTPGR
jgi:hypothetical protein